MTKISEDEVAHLATLSSISITGAQAAQLKGELSEILGYVEQLGELDTDGIEPTYQVTDLQHVTRRDEIITSSLSREQLLANAPDQADAQIKVPKVL